MNINIKKSTLKVTKKREEIINIVKNSNNPLTAEEIYDKLEKNNIEINLSTVYRTLLLLTKNNIIEKTLRSDKKCYYNIKQKGHGHYLVCINCNRTVKLDSCPIDDMCNNIYSKTGFKITNHFLEIKGVCSNCM